MSVTTWDPDDYQRDAALAEVEAQLRPVLTDEDGTWIADYTRLRVRAIRP
jgi:hypothetical protein